MAELVIYLLQIITVGHNHCKRKNQLLFLFLYSVFQIVTIIHTCQVIYDGELFHLLLQTNTFGNIINNSYDSNDITVFIPYCTLFYLKIQWFSIFHRKFTDILAVFPRSQYFFIILVIHFSHFWKLLNFQICFSYDTSIFPDRNQVTDRWSKTISTFRILKKYINRRTMHKAFHHFTIQKFHYFPPFPQALNFNLMLPLYHLPTSPST